MSDELVVPQLSVGGLFAQKVHRKDAKNAKFFLPLRPGGSDVNRIMSTNTQEGDYLCFRG